MLHTSKEITLKDLMLYESGLHKYEASTNIKNLDQAVKSIQQKGIDLLQALNNSHHYIDAYDKTYHQYLFVELI
jgi:hypothetical protein